MIINVEKWVVKDEDNDITSFKIKSIERCCNGINNIRSVEFGYNIVENYNIDDEDSTDDDGYAVGMFITKSEFEYDGFEMIRYYLINNCPCCGNKIEINILSVIDKTEEYKAIKEERDSVHEEWSSCDSIKLSTELLKRRNVLDKQINYFYETDNLQIKKEEE